MEISLKNNQSSASKKTPTKKEQTDKNFQKRFTLATQNNSFERYFEI